MNAFPLFMIVIGIAYGQMILIVFICDGREKLQMFSIGIGMAMMFAMWTYAAFFSPDMKVF